MRYKIENLKDITDSREIMQSTPDGFSKYMTYIIIALLASFLVWSIFAQKEVSVTASGIVKTKSIEDQHDYCVEVCINSQDLGEVQDGQEVMIELEPLPSSEYGYVKSNLSNISDDLKVDENQGKSYCTAVCEIGKNVLKNKNGKEVSIKNGMAARVRIINRRMSYFRYFLEKMNLVNY